MHRSKRSISQHSHTRTQTHMGCGQWTIECGVHVLVCLCVWHCAHQFNGKRIRKNKTIVNACSVDICFVKYKSLFFLSYKYLRTWYIHVRVHYPHVCMYGMARHILDVMHTFSLIAMNENRNAQIITLMHRIETCAMQLRSYTCILYCVV